MLRLVKLYLPILFLGLVCSTSYGTAIDDLYAEIYQQAIEYVRQGDLDRAKDKFQEALILKPGDSSAQKGVQLCDDRLDYYAKTYSGQRSTVSSDEVRKMRRFRFSLTSAPAVDTYENDNGKSSLSGGTGIQAELLAIDRLWLSSHPNIGWMYGGGLLLARHEGELGETDMSVTALSSTFQGGIAVKVGSSIVLEATPFVGFGESIRRASGYIDTAEWAPYYRYGMKGGAHYRLDDETELGLEVGYTAFYSDDFDGEVVSGSGVYGGIAFSKQF